jgi:hypothetical protein
MAKWILICLNCKSEFQYSQISDVPMSFRIFFVKPEFAPTGNQCVCPNCGFNGTYRRTDLLYRP